jgi:hypothetical protein
MSALGSLPAAAEKLQLVGRNLRKGSLRDQLDERPTLLLFVRHFG